MIKRGLEDKIWTCVYPQKKKELVGGRRDKFPNFCNITEKLSSMDTSVGLYFPRIKGNEINRDIKDRIRDMTVSKSQ